MYDFHLMTEEQLDKEYCRLWTNYMYYESAQKNWRSEAKERQENEKQFRAIKSEMRKRGMEF